MRPLLLAYAEEPTLAHATLPEELVYCSRQNLTVLRTTNSPAISLGCLETETLTKSFGETSDADNSREPAHFRYLDTATGTRTQQEVSETDYQGMANVRNWLDTASLTLVQQEVSDVD
jgi:hypothetical protein